MRRTTEDLRYLVGTTTKDGKKGDAALFGDREKHLVEFGWRKSKYGETTEKGRELARALREYVDKRLRHDIKEDEYEQKTKDFASDEGVNELIEKTDF